MKLALSAALPLMASIPVPQSWRLLEWRHTRCPQRMCWPLTVTTERFRHRPTVGFDGDFAAAGTGVDQNGPLRSRASSSSAMS
jgi:hypothetical protein